MHHGFFLKIFIHIWASLVAKLVKNLTTMQEIRVWFLGREDPLENGEATHFSVLGLPWWLSGSRICLQCGRPRCDPWLGKTPGEGKGYPLQCSGLENSMDCTVHGVAKTQTWLSHFHSLIHSYLVWFWSEIEGFIFFFFNLTLFILIGG